MITMTLDLSASIARMDYDDLAAMPGILPSLKWQAPGSDTYTWRLRRKPMLNAKSSTTTARCWSS
ncbi:hypothetical protein AB0903_18320 [Streptomyces sp. NPDC048389]|uniref:hypothetical protein n=1 Tax=Streptomyces sp. NPDC048389 TaxID=3154622 RepID=UPI0034544DEA